MAIRGTIDDVLLYAGTSNVEEAEAWLNAASLVVDAQLASSGLAASTLASIESHLAAHYIELGTGRTVSSERLGSWSASYATGPKGLGSLMGSRNGQIAALLDTTGALGEMSKPKPSFVVM